MSAMFSATKIRVFLLLALLGLFAAPFILPGIPFLEAQEFPEGDPMAPPDGLDPRDYKTWKKEFVPHDLMAMAFPHTLKGCSDKMAFQNVMLLKYQQGEARDSFANSKILADFVKEQYDSIRKSGVEEARYATMVDYKSCMDSAPVDENPSKAYDMNLRYGSCGQVNGVVLDTLKAIKSRRSVDSAMALQQHMQLDLSETSYAKLEDPVSYIVGQLYKSAQDTDYNGAVKMGAGLVSSCFR